MCMNFGVDLVIYLLSVLKKDKERVNQIFVFFIAFRPSECKFKQISVKYEISIRKKEEK